MNSPVPFLRMINAGDVEAVLVFCDWLEDQGDSRAKLLRRRYKMYQTELRKIKYESSLFYRSTQDEWFDRQYKNHTEAIIRYVQRKFVK